MSLLQNDMHAGDWHRRSLGGAHSGNVRDRYAERTDFDTLALGSNDLYADDGLKMTALAGRIRIDCKALHSLEIANCPDLEALDLSGCRSDLRLHLALPPKLAYLKLPDTPSGASIELLLRCTRSPIAPLAISGAIRDLTMDAEWMVHPVRLERATTETPMKGLAISPPASSPPGTSPGTWLVMGVGQSSEELTMDVAGIDHLMILGAPQREITLSNGRLDRLEVMECSRLERIGGRFNSRHAAFEVCAGLQRIEGSGDHLDVACTRADRLVLDGHWQDCEVSFSGIQTIEMDRCMRLRLKSLPALRDIQSCEDYELDIGGEMQAIDHLAKLVEEPPGGLSSLVASEGGRIHRGNSLPGHWLQLITDGTRVGDELPRSIARLKELAARSEDREAAWLTRCQLTALHLGAKRPSTDPVPMLLRASRRWCWFDYDTDYTQLWLDDLALYFHCRDLRVAAPFGRTLARLDRLIHAELLIHALRDHESGAYDPATCKAALVGCLKRLDGRRELQRIHHLWLVQRRQPRRITPEHEFERRILAMIYRLVAIGQEALFPAFASFIESVTVPSIVIESGLRLAETHADIGQKLITGGLAMDGDLEPELRARALRELLADDSNPEDQGEDRV